MKNRYPLLYHWKQVGFRRFPTIPPDIVLEVFRTQYPLPIGRGVLSDILLRHQIQHEKDSFFRAKGTHTQLIRKRYVTGKINRKQASRALMSFLPSARGGKAILNKSTVRVLRCCYDELKGCINEVRIRMDIPRKQTPSFEDMARVVEKEDIRAYCPGIEDLFRDDELRLLIEKPSIRDTAIEIICKRIRRCVMSPIKPRTLKDILFASPPCIFTAKITTSPKLSFR